jgi:hypothetical protein
MEFLRTLGVAKLTRLIVAPYILIHDYMGVTVNRYRNTVFTTIWDISPFSQWYLPGGLDTATK